MRSSLSSSLVFVAALALPAGAQQRLRVDTTFAFDKSGTVMLAVVSGDIRVTGWARDEVRIIAASQRAPIVTSLSPRRVSLDIRGRTGGRVQYEVNVPIGVRVVAKAAAGTINISGTRGEVSVIANAASTVVSETTGHTEIESATGSVRLQRATGATAVSTINGTVIVNEIDGDLDISNITGSVRITGANLSNFDFQATASDLDFSGTLAEKGRHSIDVNSGDVTLRLPPTFGATIALSAYSGDFRPIDFPVTLPPGDLTARSRGVRRDVTINGGGALISIKTFSGDVYLRKIGATTRR